MQSVLNSETKMADEVCSTGKLENNQTGDVRLILLPCFLSIHMITV